jgi:competence protein ComEA
VNLNPMSEVIFSDRISDRLEGIAGRRRDVWVLLIVVAVAVGGALLLWRRAAPAVIAPPAKLPTAAGPTAAPPGQTSGTLFVHVAGAVRRPGLYELGPEERVADAVQEAGGARRRADLDALNLAEPLVDGSQVYVARKGETPVPPGTSTPATNTSPGGIATAPVNVNTADALGLEGIPGIGPVKAAAVVEYREANGPFSSIDELLEVSGIGPATLETMRPHVSL